MITTHNIMILSAFEDQDHMTAYSDYGSLIRDVVLNPNVIS